MAGLPFKDCLHGRIAHHPNEITKGSSEIPIAE
jgi:hypothetical protein